jgi:type II secretory ATPase GspE/PulE/Tfp pilus assembly ATPase PilB-like protein
MQKLGAILVEMGYISEGSFLKALEISKQSGKMLGATLVDQGFISEEQLLFALSKQMEIPFQKTLKDIKVTEEVIRRIPVKFVWHYKFMPLAISGNGNILKIAISDPLEIWTSEYIKLHLGFTTEIVLATKQEILAAINKFYGVGADTVQKILESKDTFVKTKEVEKIERVEDLEQTAESASVVKLVDQILLSAVNTGATDIHMECFREEIRIRCRVDGVLYDMSLPDEIKQLYSAISSRVKIISNMDVVEKRLPQDGKTRVKVQNKVLDLRVSIIPSSTGENIVIRILPHDILHNLDQLGFLEEDIAVMNEVISMPLGIIFLAGPTGSGKSTTLYACLMAKKSSTTKIITIEDPVEYEIPDIMQINVTPKIGLTFAQSLRSVLRHDPDILMIGEVRDFETAEIAIRSALTGHLIFSTIHTNDATSGVERLIDMGVEHFLLVSAVKVIIGQRLVRVICEKCKTECSDLRVLGLHNIPVTRHFIGKGCDACRNTGYKGRTTIYEIFKMEKEVQEMVLARASGREIRKKARELGMKTMREIGWEKVRRGITTVQEVLMVTEGERM